MSLLRILRGARGRVRPRFKFGPYFRNYSASVDRQGVRGGFRSHGLRFPLPRWLHWVGRSLTLNLTLRRWSLDTPGPGSVSGSWDDAEEPEQEAGQQCGQRIASRSGVQGHPCAEQDDGHTMHRCARGDCSWGR